ncbi:uncharacterized protein DSM5745_07588 [Aspergillus mulundensis]|uniref:LysM domain-containing protein n=1 Tax=Aspergillus mulundensis TaxID=1810919 RepID=A0A3D8REP3_9EURO|nr:Uncharacterized protein DSM5745_07588 [Aspergillus mulundensis]RDW72416.1 Uncharacterized protein DSM5745_07588 [Aspergillus mulundensis]
MVAWRMKSLIALLALSLPAIVLSTSCDPSTLNSTTYLYPITTPNTTVFDVAKATNRGVCDIGRQNLMADVTIVPNVGQTLLIPPETCEPDNETCLLPNTTRTRACINGGPRNYYTVNGDTYDIIARRLNITTESMTALAFGDVPAGPNDELAPGQFIKVPLCEPSHCVIQPYRFTWGVYKDLAEEFGTTVGQLMMLSPTYNYSSKAFLPGGEFPSMTILVNCTEGVGNETVLT